LSSLFFYEEQKVNRVSAAHTVLVADKVDIHKILVEEDLVKALFFDGLRPHPGNPMLVTERDKVAHKHTVNSNSVCLLVIVTSDFLSETTFVPWFLS
jgi:hypothetical protein